MSYQDEHKREVRVMRAPSDTLDQILAPLNISKLEIRRKGKGRGKKVNDGDDDGESDGSDYINNKIEFIPTLSRANNVNYNAINDVYSYNASHSNSNNNNNNKTTESNTKISTVTTNIQASSDEVESLSSSQQQQSLPSTSTRRVLLHPNS